MKRCLILLFIVITSLVMTGCDDSILKYGSQNEEDSDSLYYFFTRIDDSDVPDGWKTSDYQSYYYEVDTKVVYIGSNSLSSNNAIMVKLESEQYRCYIYDKSKNEFKGVE